MGQIQPFSHILNFGGLEAWIDWATRSLECHEVGETSVLVLWFNSGNSIKRNIYHHFIFGKPKIGNEKG